jgi:hypothetical protein
MPPLKVQIVSEEKTWSGHILTISVNEKIYSYKVISPVFIKRFENKLKWSEGKALNYLIKVGELIRE